MARTTTTVEEFDATGKMIKRTVTVVDGGGYHYYGSPWSPYYPTTSPYVTYGIQTSGNLTTTTS